MQNKNYLNWELGADGAREAAIWERVEEPNGEFYKRHVITYRVMPHGTLAHDGESRIFTGHYKCTYATGELPPGMISGLLQASSTPDHFLFNYEQTALDAAENHLRENFPQVIANRPTA